MFFALTWFLALTLLAIWSVTVWVLHALVLWSLTQVGALADQPQQMEALPEWVTIWLPPDWMVAFKAITAAVLPVVDSAFSLLPSAANWLTPLAWVSWGMGLVILLGGGLAVTALISMTRRAAA